MDKLWRQAHFWIHDIWSYDAVLIFYLGSRHLSIIVLLFNILLQPHEGPGSWRRRVEMIWSLIFTHLPQRSQSQEQGDQHEKIRYWWSPSRMADPSEHTVRIVSPSLETCFLSISAAKYNIVSFSSSSLSGAGWSHCFFWEETCEKLNNK